MSNKFLFIGFDDINLNNSFQWNDYRSKFNPLDYDSVFLKLTKWEKIFSGKISSDLNELIDAGKDIFVVYNHAESRGKSPLGHDIITENISLLPFFSSSKNFSFDNGFERTVKIEGFDRYFRHLKTWSWYYNGNLVEGNIIIVPIAVNKINKPVSFIIFEKYSKESHSGCVFMLPEIEEVCLGIKELLIDFCKMEISSKEPIWINDIKTHNEEKLLISKNKLKERIKKEGGKIRDTNLRIRNERNIKRILYTDGIELEENIKKLFRNVGLKPYREKISEEDCFIKSKYGNFLFEIKGSISSFNKKGVRQLADWYDEFEGRGFKIDRCIFLGNHFKNIPINKRPYPFEDNIIIFAEKNEFLLLLTTDLFELYNLFLRKKISLKDICQIFKNSPTKFNFNNCKTS